MLYLREQLQHTINLKKPLYCHPELCLSRINKDLQVIHEVKLALEECDTNPYKPTNSLLTLHWIASNAVLVKSMHIAHNEGNTISEAILDRLSSGSRLLHDPMSKTKNKNICNTDCVHCKEKVKVLVDHTATKQVINLLMSGETPTMTLLGIMQYEITTVSLSLFTADYVS